MKTYLVVVVALLISVIAAVKPAWAGASAVAKPRIMVLMDEKNVGGYSINQAETTICDFLMDKGYKVIDTEMVKAKLKRDQALQQMTESNRAAAALGLQFGTEIVVVGRAIAKGSSRQIGQTGMRSYQGTVSAKAIKTDTAELLGTTKGAASKPHVDDTEGGSEAIRLATLQMMEELFPLIEKNGPGVSGEHIVEIVMSDVTQMWQLAALKRILKEKVNGTADASQRSFVSGVATFDVETTLDSQGLAEALVVVEGEPFRIKIIGVSPNKLDAKLVMMDE